jgi:uncharacterized protein (DUF111 family)
LGREAVFLCLYLAQQVDDMLFMANVDDVSGETISHVVDGLMTLGAGSVYVTPAITKKGRPGFLFFVDTPEDRIESLGSYMASELGTLGIRVLETRHITFDYRVLEVLVIDHARTPPIQVLVRVKEIKNNEGQVVSVKADYEDLRMALTQFQKVGVEFAFAALKGLVEQTVLGRQDHTLHSIRAVYPRGG